MRRLSKHRLALCLTVSLVAPALAAAAQKAAKQQYRVTVVTDREDALYSVGQKVEFAITLRRGKEPVTTGKVSYVLDNDGAEPVTRGTVSLSAQPAVVSGTLDKPGFLRCRVSYQTAEKKTVTAMAAAGIDPTAIPPSLPVPDDFDVFWAEQKKKLAELPLLPELTPVPCSVNGIEAFDVQVRCLGDKPVSGYFARPAGAKPKSLPAILFVHGAGVRSSSLSKAISGAQMGTLAMDMNAHGIPNGKPSEYYTNLAQGELKDYRRRGHDDRQQCYFLGMFLRVKRGLDFLTAQPEWDGQVLVATGHSQGGGQSIVAAGLDERVTFFAAGVPAICDHSGRAVGRISGWPKLVPNDAAGKPDPKSLEVARYFDGMNFAARAKGAALFSVGFIDVTCPPTSVYAAYNNVPGAKRILNEPLMGHAAPANIQKAFTKAIQEHVASVHQAGR